MNNLTKWEKNLVSRGYIPTSIGIPLGNVYVEIVTDENKVFKAKSFCCQQDLSIGFHILEDNKIIDSIHIRDVSGWKAIYN